MVWNFKPKGRFLLWIHQGTHDAKGSLQTTVPPCTQVASADKMVHAGNTNRYWQTMQVSLRSAEGTAAVSMTHTWNGEPFTVNDDSWLALRTSFISFSELCIWVCFVSILRTRICISCKQLITTVPGVDALAVRPTDPDAMKTRKFLICAQKYRYCIRILQLSANHKRDQGANLKIDNGRASATLLDLCRILRYGTTVSSSFDYEAARRHGGYAEGYLRNGSRSSHWDGGGHRARSTRSTMYPTCPCSLGARVKRGKRRRNGIYWSSVSCELTVDFQWVRRSSGSKLAYRWWFRRWWWVGLIIAIYLLAIEKLLLHYVWEP